MNKRNLIILSVIILFISLTIYVIEGVRPAKHLVFNPPTSGIVPDEATAIKIAETIGMPVFGKNLNEYKPFHAELRNDSIWHVYGLPKKMWFAVQLGGGPVFEIQKTDGKILKVDISR
jgi:hypothetical protein